MHASLMKSVRKKMIDNIDMPDISIVYYNLSSMQKIENCIIDILKTMDNNTVFEKVDNDNSIYFNIKGEKYQFKCRILICDCYGHKGKFCICFMIESLQDLNGKIMDNFDSLIDITNVSFFNYEDFFYKKIFLFPGDVNGYLDYYPVDDLTDVMALVDLHTIPDIKDILKNIIGKGTSRYRKEKHNQASFKNLQIFSF